MRCKEIRLGVRLDVSAEKVKISGVEVELTERVWAEESRSLRSGSGTRGKYPAKDC